MWPPAGILVFVAFVAGSSALAGTAPVAVDRAVALFDRVCGASLPRFEDVDRALVDAGFTPSGMLAGHDAQLTTRDAIDGEPVCTLAFTTEESPRAADRVFARLGPLADTQMGRLTRYRETLLRIEGPSPDRGRDRYLLQFRPEP
ncbi:MAG: hypothetical protein AAFR35_01335 [Pseudomonadota bacterium]